MSLRALRCAEPAPSDPELEHDDLDWAKRCEIWAARVQRAGGRRAVRERPRQPLALSGHGVTLRVENGALTIRNGFTHYPQRQETYRYFKGEHAIPERIIMIDGSVRIPTQAGRGFRFDPGRRSDLMPATIPR